MQTWKYMTLGLTDAYNRLGFAGHDVVSGAAREAALHNYAAAHEALDSMANTVPMDSDLWRFFTEVTARMEFQAACRQVEVALDADDAVITAGGRDVEIMRAMFALLTAYHPEMIDGQRLSHYANKIRRIAPHLGALAAVEAA